MYAIRSYYGEFKFAEVIAFLTDNQELKFISKDKYIVSIENGHLVFTKEWFDESEEWEDLSDYVITSYSIHYTKLYENE